MKLYAALYLIWGIRIIALYFLFNVVMSFADPTDYYSEAVWWGRYLVSLTIIVLATPSSLISRYLKKN